MKFVLRSVTACLVLAVSVFGMGAEFTLDDLKQMVKEIEAVAPKHPALTYPVECRIIEDKNVNAGATAYRPTPGAKWQALMEVNTGLIEYAKGDKRLIRGVVAHEIAHLSNGHIFVANIQGIDAENLWDRQQEREADMHGAIYLQRLGYSKDDMRDMLLMLESMRGRSGNNWFARLTGTHPDPKARAAEVASNADVLKALVTFDSGLAYMDARSYGSAAKLFDAAYAKQPELVEAAINSAQCHLMNYYYSLSPEYRDKLWFRFDIGPALTAPTILNRDPVMREEDRERYRIAVNALTQTLAKVGSNQRIEELIAIAQVMEPDGKQDIIRAGISVLDIGLRSLTDQGTRLRFAANIAAGYVRLGNNKAAYDILVGTQKGTTIYNAALAENLGRLKMSSNDNEANTIAINLTYTWLLRTPNLNDQWQNLLGFYQTLCRQMNIQVKTFEELPIYLCNVVSVNIRGKEIGLLTEMESVLETLGKPDLELMLDKRYPDLKEFRWNGSDNTVWFDRGNTMRVTSYEKGSFIELKPKNTTLSFSAKISVGMSLAEFSDVLDINGADAVKLNRGGLAEDWFYFAPLRLGVLVKNDMITGITVTPVKMD